MFSDKPSMIFDGSDGQGKEWILSNSGMPIAKWKQQGGSSAINMGWDCRPNNYWTVQNRFRS